MKETFEWLWILSFAYFERVQYDHLLLERELHILVKDIRILVASPRWLFNHFFIMVSQFISSLICCSFSSNFVRELKLHFTLSNGWVSSLINKRKRASLVWRLTSHLNLHMSHLLLLLFLLPYHYYKLYYIYFLFNASPILSFYYSWRLLFPQHYSSSTIWFFHFFPSMYVLHFFFYALFQTLWNITIKLYYYASTTNLWFNEFYLCLWGHFNLSK